jgi:TolA-binding protein
MFGITGWVAGGSLARSGGGFDPATAITVAIASAICGIVLGITWATNIAGILAKPLTSLFDGGNQEIEPQPLYSIAEARRKQGKYLEAVAEVRKQLARFPGDYAGMMMLADIQAEDLKDLTSAQITVERVLSEPEQTPNHVAAALNRLADWHLKLGQDPDSARAALEQIIQSLPETEHAYHATQRIAHLTTPQMLAEKKEPHRVKLGQYEQRVGLLTEPSAVRPPGEDAAAQAANYVKQLEQFPQDSDAREKLSLIYAEHYQRLDLAAAQLEELIAQPNAPARQVVHWLNQLADLSIRHSADVVAGRQVLERIIELYPKSAAAESAKNRIAHLQLELRSQKKSQAVKLGSYEQNIGLKGPPRFSG